MRRATLLLVSLMALARIALGCGGASTPAVEVALPVARETTVPPAPTTEPKAVPGLDTTGLDEREAKLFWQMVSQLYAPCSHEAVSIRQCVEETRACTACAPAARLLAQKIKEGAGAEQAREIYAARFGPKVKQIDAGDSPSRGPRDAPVTVIVWSDFECPHCKHAMPIFDRIVAKYGSSVRLVHKFYPLRQHLRAEPAARAAIAAQNQGRYWEMERTLFDHQEAQEDSDITRYAQELKLDLTRFRADLTADRTSRILERDHTEAEGAGLTGTPFILINGREFDTSYFHLDSDLDAWIDLELELARKR